MRRRSWTRWVVKWIGTILCVFVLGIWCASPFRALSWQEKEWWWMFWAGTLWVKWHEDVQSPRIWGCERIPPAVRGHWVLGTWRWVPKFRAARQYGKMYYELTVPLWIPTALVGFPSAFLWWLDRRRFPPGHCERCGYNLTGNVSGICLECGRPVEAEAKAIAISAQ